MTTICKRGRGLNGVTLVANCSGKKKCSSRNKTSACKKSGSRNVFSVVYKQYGASNTQNYINVNTFPSLSVIDGDLTIYGTRNCGFNYVQGAPAEPFKLISGYAGNYEVNICLQGDCTTGENIVFTILIDGVLQSNIIGVLIPTQSGAQSGLSGGVSITGILKLSKNSVVTLAFYCQNSTNSIDIKSFNMTITSP